MHKKIICHGLQLVAMSLFIVIALACESQSSIVTPLEGARGGNSDSGGSSSDGSAIEIPVDSIKSVNDLALK